MHDAFRFAPARSVPLVLQQEQAECGLACLAMIAGRHGRRVALPALRAMCPASTRGATLGELLQAGAALRLTGRPVRLELAELARLRLPAILHWRLDHFVVLVRLRGGTAIVHDPARGRRKVGPRELDASFTGVAVEFSPAADFAGGDETDALPLTALLRGCSHRGRYLALMLLLLFPVQLLSLVPPVFTQWLIDEVLAGQDPSWLWRALGGLAAVLVAAALLEAMRRWIGLFAGSVLATEATRNVVRHLYSLPAGFVLERHPGDVMSRLASLEPIRKALMETGLNALLQAVVVVASLTIMLLYSPALTLVSLGGMMAAGLLLAAVLPPGRRANEEALLHRAGQDSSLLETLRANVTVDALGIAPMRLAQWQNHFAAAMNARLRAGRLLIWQHLGGSLIAAGEQVFFLGLGIRALLEQRLTLGVLFAFMTLRGRLAQATATLIAAGRELHMIRLHLARLSDIVLASPPPDPPPGAVAHRVRGRLEARRVSFRYAGGPWIVRDFCCEIEAGEFVVIAGPSGCGKSTVLGLLSGRLCAGAGQVLVDGRELPLWDAPALRRQFAIVLQQDALFRGSLADNISAFDPQPDLGRARDAAAAAGIWRDIERMPMMLATKIGETGGTLSGGQRQRLVVARALYRQPRVLFLDEATSELDADAERRLLDHVESLGITVVSVTHRPGAVRGAGRVIRLEAVG